MCGMRLHACTPPLQVSSPLHAGDSAIWVPTLSPTSAAEPDLQLFPPHIILNPSRSSTWNAFETGSHDAVLMSLELNM